VLVTVRVRSDAPRLLDVPPLSMTIVNDQPRPSDDTSLQSAAEHDDRSSSEHSKRLSSERRKRRQPSLDRRRIHLTDKSEASTEKISKTTENAKKSVKKLVSVGVEKDSSDLSDDSSSVVAVQKRLSRAKTVRMYRTVKQQQHDDNVDDDDDKDVADDGGNKTSQPAPESMISGRILRGKKLNSSKKDKKWSEKHSSVASGRDKGRKESQSVSTSSSCSSTRKHKSNSSEEKQKSTKLSHRKTGL